MKPLIPFGKTKAFNPEKVEYIRKEKSGDGHIINIYLENSAIESFYNSEEKMDDQFDIILSMFSDNKIVLVPFGTDQSIGINPNKICSISKFNNDDKNSLEISLTTHKLSKTFESHESRDNEYKVLLKLTSNFGDLQ